MVIAASPSQRPPGAKLLVVDENGRLLHAPRARLAEHLRPDDVLIANDAATIPASLRGVHERTGAEIEVRLAGRRSLEPDDVRAFTAVTFGEGDHRTRTEDRPARPWLERGDLTQAVPRPAVQLEKEKSAPAAQFAALPATRRPLGRSAERARLGCRSACEASVVATRVT